MAGAASGSSAASSGVAADPAMSATATTYPALMSSEGGTIEALGASATMWIHECQEASGHIISIELISLVDM